MRIILTGATGMVGEEVLKQCLRDSSIDHITILTRKSTGIAHPKIQELILNSFLDYSAISGDLQKYDACIWCIGISQNVVSKEAYIKITVDYAVEAAKVMFKINPLMNFCFLSGQGADQQEKSKFLFGRIKGRAERELSALSSNVYSFRPGYIRPSSARKKARLSDLIFTPLTLIINLFTNNFSVTSAQLAKSMIRVASNGASLRILDNKSIRLI